MHDAVATAYAELVDGRSDTEPSETPLLASRSLGRLLGLEMLSFKVECRQPTGSWLDRSAASLVMAAVHDGRTGLCALGLDAWTLPLAVRCARVGLRFVVLEPIGPACAGGGLAPPEPDRSCERRWLSALGVETIAVEADGPALCAAAPSAVERAGLRLVQPDDPLLQAGLSGLVRQVQGAGGAGPLLAVPGLTGREHSWLATIARRSSALPLPLPDLPTAPTDRPSAVVGTLMSSGSVVSSHDGAGGDAGPVLAVAVSPREADAARRLLAREEGLLVSRTGCAGLAGLVRALREDRARRPRERRLRQVTSAVVVTGDPIQIDDGPPPEPDAVPRRPVSLDSLQTDLARLLVEPPGR